MDKIYKPMTLKESHFSCSTTKIRGNPGINQFIPEKISCGWFVFARYVPDKDQSVAPTRATASFGGHGAGLDERATVQGGWLRSAPGAFGCCGHRGPAVGCRSVGSSGRERAVATVTASSVRFTLGVRQGQAQAAGARLDRRQDLDGSGEFPVGPLTGVGGEGGDQVGDGGRAAHAGCT